MATPKLTLEEALETLRHTEIPTVVVEGDTDAWLLRRLDAFIRETAANVDVMEVGGRENVLALFEGRAKLKPHVVFLADQDMFAFTGIPEKYREIVWTSGYSIENDVYHQSPVEALLEGKEAADHRRLIAQLSRFFAFAVERHITGSREALDQHPKAIVDCETFELQERVTSRPDWAEPPQARWDEILTEYPLKLRGKYLFEALAVFLKHPKRPIKHTPEALMELCVCLHPTPGLQRIVGELVAQLVARGFGAR